MRVLVWPADDQGCGHSRLIWPAVALAAQGADVTVDTTGPSVLWDRKWTGEHAPAEANVAGLAERPAADVVVLQRPGRKQWAQLIPHLQAAGVRVVVDVDDDFEHIDPRNASFGSYAPRLNPHHNHSWIRRAAELADVTTVSTAALADAYAGTGRVVVLPNLVPETYLAVDAEPLTDGPVAGWTGSVLTHPGDLEVTAGALFRALDQSAGRFHVVGTGEGVAERIGVEAVTATGWLPLDRYAVEYARLDVAVVPLADTRFNNGKSALKVSEAAALGVPVVMSPTPDNLRVHGLGVGLVASHPGKWQRQVSRLLRDAQLRADVAGRGREAMAELTYEKRCGRWYDVWSSVVERKAVA